MSADSAIELGQYMTPDWAAAELVERYFGDLGASDRVIEPTCGRGAFLRALPDQVPAVGVEIDPRLASQARALSGRQVIVGDFRTVELPFTPTALVGNPPFRLKIIEGLLERAFELLDADGRVGFILPCYTLQTPATVTRLAARWSIEQAMLPRTLFDRLSHPLCFAVLTKGPLRGLVGFALYHETAAVQRLQKRYQDLLREGEGSVWAAVVRAALEVLGGRAELQAIYREIEGHRPTTNPFWQAKVRQTLRRVGRRVAPATWQLQNDQAAAA